jgi:hypothetical protein
LDRLQKRKRERETERERERREREREERKKKEIEEKKRKDLALMGFILLLDEISDKQIKPKKISAFQAMRK